MASFLYRVDGDEEQIKPANGSHWALEELQTLVGGYIEVVRTHLTPGWLVVDEEGLLKKKRMNGSASALAGRFIVGDAVFIDTIFELNGPEDES